MLGNRDTGERCSDNLSIARQKVEIGRLKVRMIKDFRGRTGTTMGIQTPLLVIDRRTCLVHVYVIPNRWVTHLRVGDVLIRLDMRERNRRTPEAFRDMSDVDRRQRNMFRSSNELNNMYLILISVISD